MSEGSERDKQDVERVGEGRPVARAAVQVAPRSLRLVDVPVPEVGTGDTLVRVEACGICGTDIERYLGGPSMPLPFPFIPGHEPVGVVEQIGEVAAQRRALSVGDRVAVDPFVSCGICRHCLAGERQHCANSHTYGRTGLDRASGLWGGFASHLIVPLNAVLYDVPATVPAEIAVLYNPLGAGFSWALEAGGLGPGESVLVLGSGQRGLACVIAASSVGAGTIVATGLARDHAKLRVARRLGATVTVDVETEDLGAICRTLTDGQGFDVVIDTTPHATEPLADAIGLVRAGGRVVLGGIKRREADGFDVDQIIAKALTVVGVKGVSPKGYVAAIEAIASGRFPLHELRTHSYPLAEAGYGVEVLAGMHGGQAINVIVVPGEGD